jgi:hypothetical protein
MKKVATILVEGEVDEELLENEKLFVIFSAVCLY